MNILVINGSPKGENSITLQTVLYMEKKRPGHSFEVINAGSRLRSLEKDFSLAKAQLERAELILFSYPVYTFIVPSQLTRFLELIQENAVDLSGKYAAQLSTSKHFYDVTAHRFIEDRCTDLGLHYIDGLSADMDDLTKKQGQKDALAFFDHLCWSVEKGIFRDPIVFKRAETLLPAAPAKPVAKTGKRVAIVADLAPEDTLLKSLIDRFTALCPMECSLVNIHEFPFAGGCVSCFHCAADGVCIYKDGFSELLRDRIQTADAIVTAFSIKDHCMGSRFKTFDDRQFCNGHRTVTAGTPFGYLINGDLSCETNLQLILEGRAQVGGNYLAGIVSTEKAPEPQIDRMIQKLCYAVDRQYSQPANFLGVGGMKIFRDLIWLMQGMMKADHRFYKEHGQYDFPQKKPGTLIGMYLVGAMISNPKVQKKIGGRMTEGMLMPYKKVLNEKEKTITPLTRAKRRFARLRAGIKK